VVLAAVHAGQCVTVHTCPPAGRFHPDRPGQGSNRTSGSKVAVRAGQARGYAEATKEMSLARLV